MQQAAALVELGLDDDAARIAVRVGLELLDLCDEQDHLQEVIDADLLLGRDRDHDRVSAVFLRHEALLHELLLDAVRIGTRLIDLVDGDDDRHACRFRVVDGLDRLRHDAVVSSDDEDGDIRDLGAARTHGREGLMARRVEEDDLLALAVDLVRTDVLRDAAGSCVWTCVLRMQSSSDVLPWSTWPMTVTTGGRSFSDFGSSSISGISVGSTSGGNSSHVTPNSEATRAAVSKSISWLIVAMTPIMKSFLTTSAAV